VSNSTFPKKRCTGQFVYDGWSILSNAAQQVSAIAKLWWTLTGRTSTMEEPALIAPEVVFPLARHSIRSVLPEIVRRLLTNTTLYWQLILSAFHLRLHLCQHGPMERSRRRTESICQNNLGLSGCSKE
jgi:hypothetical protein